MKMTAQYTTSENLSLGRTQRMNRNIVGKFFNMLEKTTTKNNHSYTAGNIFNIDECGKQINTQKKLDSVITENGSQMFVSLHRDKRVRILQLQDAVMLQINFCPIFKEVNKKQDFGNG